MGPTTDGRQFGHPSPDQISLGETASFKATRDRIVWMLWTMFSILCVGGGLLAFPTKTELEDQLIVGAIILVGLPRIVLILVRGVVWVRARHRLRHDRCMNCAYDISHPVSAMCPECGKDPFELELPPSTLSLLIGIFRRT